MKTQLGHHENGLTNRLISSYLLDKKVTEQIHKKLFIMGAQTTDMVYLSFHIFDSST